MADRDAVAADLCALLDAEAAALRRGELEGLEATAAAKTALAEALAAAPPAAQALRGLQSRLARNAVLLEAAAAGLRAACDRLEALLRAAAGTDTYDGHGRRRHLANPAVPRLERRA